jgi:uncharacterized protein (TIGR02145 family)
VAVRAGACVHTNSPLSAISSSVFFRAFLSLFLIKFVLMKWQALFLSTGIALIYLFGQTPGATVVSDIDGNFYKTVVIGDRLWMAENLKVSRYRNGDTVFHAVNNSDWRNRVQGAWCYYENDSAKGKIYGKLYNWHAVNDPRGLCPIGWHIPSDEEWTALLDFLGGNKKADALKAPGFWNKPNEPASNSTGFTALPAGIRYYEGRFIHLGNFTGFWSSTEGNRDFAWFRYFDRSSKSGRIFFGKQNGFSCRCVKDADKKP